MARIKMNKQNPKESIRKYKNFIKKRKRKCRLQLDISDPCTANDKATVYTTSRSRFGNLKRRCCRLVHTTAGRCSRFIVRVFRVAGNLFQRRKPDCSSVGYHTSRSRIRLIKTLLCKSNYIL